MATSYTGYLIHVCVCPICFDDFTGKKVDTSDTTAELTLLWKSEVESILP